MDKKENSGKRQHFTKRKTAEVKRFSKERIEQFEKERESHQDGGIERPKRNFKPRRNGDRHESNFGSRNRKFGDRPIRKRYDSDENRSYRRLREEYNDNRSFKNSREKSNESHSFRNYKGNCDDNRGFRSSIKHRFKKKNLDYHRNEEDRPYAKRCNSYTNRDEKKFYREDHYKKPRHKAEHNSGGFRRKEKDPLYDRPKATGQIRLNKYLADAGICSRREADDLILAGAVTVNNEVVTKLGTKVEPTDKVIYGGETLNREKLRYVLLNKPKGVITTSDDPYERHTVMEFVKDACEERIYPVGRLDRNTIGLLLLTNDGELAKILTHPSHEVKKLYQATLDKSLTKNDLARIREGLTLEDGPIQVDSIDWVVDDPTKREVGIEIHSGRNHIVRRIFESLGYEVVKLDRMIFAGLTKQNLPRGHWRFLTNAEISMLKRIQ